MKKLLSFIVIQLLVLGCACSVSAEEASTTLHIEEEGQSYVNFSVAGVMPGDLISKQVDLIIDHNVDSEIYVTFEANEDSSPELMEAFDVAIYVEELDEILYEGKLADLEEYTVCVIYTDDSEVLHYTIELFLPEETGNECANKILSGTFIWSCESVGELSDDSDVVVQPEDTKEESEEESETAEQAETGDDSIIWSYVAISTIAICGFGALLIQRKRRGGTYE